jgi:hypothetical protein
MGSASISVDEFQALEQKVLQTVELIKREREARAAAETARAVAEAEVAAAQAELAARNQELALRGQELALRGQEIVVLRQELAASGDVHGEIQSLQREREAVRLRVEKMLASIEEVF